MRIGLLGLALSLIATSATAQPAPAAGKSSHQIVCELSGSCDSEPNARETDAPVTRGFSIVRPGGDPRGLNESRTQPGPAVGSSHKRDARTPAAGRTNSSVRPRVIGHSDLTINFISGSALLTASGRAQAREFLRAMNSPQLTGKRFRVAGHTDAVGSRRYNLDLSTRRAQAVVDYLVGNGAQPSQFEVRGYGFDRPASPSNPRAAANRRVEFVKID